MPRCALIKPREVFKDGPVQLFSFSSSSYDQISTIAGTKKQKHTTKQTNRATRNIEMRRERERQRQRESERKTRDARVATDGST